MVELSERQRHVLRSVVQEYINSATPVSSKVITADYELGVSSATIRHEMAMLEELGFLTQPHTSAGRVPTEVGYRYFVENLMRSDVLPTAEQRMISHQFHQSRLELDQWLRLSAAVLAHASQNASLVTAPKSGQCFLKHVDLVSIQETVMLLILVLQGGIVKQQILTLEQPASRDELSMLARQLTDLWSGLEADGIAEASRWLATELAGQVAAVTVETMRRIEARLSSDIYRDGLLNVLNQPDFKEHQNMLQQTIRALEEQWLVEQLVDDVLQRGGIQIIIGGEGRWGELSQVSIVLARYGIDKQISGVMGVIGPMRMPYGRSVSVVRYMSHLLSNLVGNLYGYNDGGNHEL